MTSLSDFFLKVRDLVREVDEHPPPAPPVPPPPGLTPLERELCEMLRFFLEMAHACQYRSGNPVAVEKMLESARAVLAKAKEQETPQ